MKTSFVFISERLRTFWESVLLKKGWSFKELAEASGVSYNHARRIANGTLIPGRVALRKMCDATGQDFNALWAYLHGGPDLDKDDPEIPESLVPPNDGTNTDKDPAVRHLVEAMRRRLLDIFDQLPPDACMRLMEEAWRLAERQNPESNQ